MRSWQSSPLTWLMAAASLVADFAWLAGGTHRLDPERWQTFMLWGGWSQAAAIAAWSVLGSGDRLPRATGITLTILALATGSRLFTTPNASSYTALVALQISGVASAALLLKSSGLLATWTPRPHPRPAHWRFGVKHWFGWTALAAVWATLLPQGSSANLGEEPLLVLTNLIGAPTITLLACGIRGGTALRTILALTALGAAIALAYFSTAVAYHGAWSGLVVQHLVHANLAQTAYLFAWWWVIQLDATHREKSRDGSEQMELS